MFSQNGTCTYSDNGGSSVNGGNRREGNGSGGNAFDADVPATLPESGCDMLMLRSCLLQLRQQTAQRLAAMTALVFVLGAELGRRQAERRQQKVRIVAKAVFPARGVDNLTRPATLRDQRLRVLGMAHQHDDAGVMRLTPTRALLLSLSLSLQAVDWMEFRIF